MDLGCNASLLFRQHPTCPRRGQHRWPLAHRLAHRRSARLNPSGALAWSGPRSPPVERALEHVVVTTGGPESGDQRLYTIAGGPTRAGAQRGPGRAGGRGDRVGRGAEGTGSGGGAGGDRRPPRNPRVRVPAGGLRGPNQRLTRGRPSWSQAVGGFDESGVGGQAGSGPRPVARSPSMAAATWARAGEHPAQPGPAGGAHRLAASCPAPRPGHRVQERTQSACHRPRIVHLPPPPDRPPAIAPDRRTGYCPGSPNRLLPATPRFPPAQPLDHRSKCADVPDAEVADPPAAPARDQMVGDLVVGTDTKERCQQYVVSRRVRLPSDLSRRCKAVVSDDDRLNEGVQLQISQVLGGLVSDPGDGVIQASGLPVDLVMLPVSKCPSEHCEGHDVGVTSGMGQRRLAIRADK